MTGSPFDEVTRPDPIPQLIARGMAAEREFHDAEQHHRTLDPEASRFLSFDSSPS